MLMPTPRRVSPDHRARNAISGTKVEIAKDKNLINAIVIAVLPQLDRENKQAGQRLTRMYENQVHSRGTGSWKWNYLGKQKSFAAHQIDQMEGLFSGGGVGMEKAEKARRKVVRSREQPF
jgi:hypothetical protein